MDEEEADVFGTPAPATALKRAADAMTGTRGQATPYFTPKALFSASSEHWHEDHENMSPDLAMHLSTSVSTAARQRWAGQAMADMSLQQITSAFNVPTSRFTPSVVTLQKEQHVSPRRVSASLVRSGCFNPLMLLGAVLEGFTERSALFNCLYVQVALSACSPHL
jgi:hypothetical protein